MDNIKTGKLIKSIRLRKGMTQRELGDKIGVSDKTVSKWERGLGSPDISIFQDVCRILGVNADGMLSGELKTNTPQNGNMKNCRFYVCPLCRNVIITEGEAVICCCGGILEPAEKKGPDAAHEPQLEPVEDEWSINFAHPMEKGHYISFAALVSGDSVNFKKLYPEGDARLRFKRRGHGILFWYCTEHKLFYRLI